LKPKGKSKSEVLKKLKQAKQLDQQYENGKILCSMCTNPHPIAKKAYNMFLNSNLGDMGLFSGSAQLEKEVVSLLVGLLHGEGGCGFLVSGGTEANLMALWAAKRLAKKPCPEVVLPESAHFSFTKICNMLSLKPVYAKLDEVYRVDVLDVEKNVTENTEPQN
jgi:tyrosine decarboxylase/aspartate 1-decarboxylase